MSWGRLAVFLLVVLTVTVLVHLYFWLRLVKAPGWPEPWPKVGTIAIALLGASIPIGMIAGRVLPREAAAPFAWVAFVWMGVMFFLFVILLPSELVRLAHGLSQMAGEDAPDPARRQLLSRGIAAVALAGSTGLGVFSLFGGLREVAVKRVPVGLRKVGAGLDGFRIAQLTDVHVGPTIGREFIEQIVRTTNALEPDLIAITGDLVDGSVDELREHVAPLAALRARHGVFFVTGNHEYYSGAAGWTAHLRSLGIHVLENDAVTLDHDGEPIAIAGVLDHHADRFGEASDVDAAVEGLSAEIPKVLLAHQPLSIAAAARAGVDLQISGHTHGGQLFPFNYLVRLQQPFVAGLHRLEETALYVSSGTGYWGPPMRLGAPAEITELVLTTA